MPGLNAIVLAILAFLLAGGASLAYFGIRGRQRAEVAAGLDALSELRWREFNRLVLESLRREGYDAEEGEFESGRVGFDAVLRREGERQLLVCKHARHFRVGDAVIRDFVTTIRMQSAAGGIIATLGSVEPGARELAAGHHIDVVDGPALWQRVHSLMPVATRHQITERVDALTKRRLVTSAVVALVLGIVVLVAVPSPGPSAVTGGTSTQQAASTTRAAQEGPQADAPGLGDEQLEERRADARERIAGDPAYADVRWETRSTLALELRADDIDSDQLEPLTAQACDVLTEYDELRYTRLQFEPPQGSTQPVRWRPCH